MTSTAPGIGSFAIARWKPPTATPTATRPRNGATTSASAWAVPSRRTRSSTSSTWTTPIAIFRRSTGPLYFTVAGTTLGSAQAYPRTYPSENRYQLVDNYSWTKGAHTAKFGMDFQTTQDWTNQLFNEFGGYSYSNLLAFAKDFSGNTPGLKSYTSFTQQFGNPIKTMRTTD